MHNSMVLQLKGLFYLSPLLWVQGDVSASRESEREMGTWSHQLFD